VPLHKGLASTDSEGGCEVYIFEHDVEKAKPLLEEFAPLSQ